MASPPGGPCSPQNPDPLRVSATDSGSAGPRALPVHAETASPVGAFGAEVDSAYGVATTAKRDLDHGLFEPASRNRASARTWRQAAGILRPVSSLAHAPTFPAIVNAAWATVVFVVALFVGAKILPGRRVQGFPQADGTRKIYKINGMALWITTHIAVVTTTLLFDQSLAGLVQNFWSYFVVANLLAVAGSLALYLDGIRSQRRRPGFLGFTKDFWYGVELNPTWAGVDLKTFAYQPSLIGLSLLNVAFAYAQYEQTGSLTPQMIAYQVFWWLYMTTHYHYEVGVLSMWDIIAEKFGFMLVWGDLVLVPFFYCIGGWWLVQATGPMSPVLLMGITAFFGLGLWIFRGANAQKDRFKRDPGAPIWGKAPKTIGGRLLVSGWWGFGRKINYTGEIMVYTSFALCTGFDSVVPYLLPLWLCVLLPHRAWRDEKRCIAKYGPLWQQYTRQARFRMIPFLY